MKDITKEMLEDFDKEYKDNSLQRVVRHALYKNDLSKVALRQEMESEVLNNFSIDIKTMSATSQMQSGRCWLFAGLNVLREVVATKLNLENFELSQNYMAFWDKYEKINYVLNALIEEKEKPWDDRVLDWLLETGLQDGGQWDMVVSIIKKYGVVPSSVMLETQQSSHTRDFIALVNRYLRKFAVDIRKMNDEEIKNHKAKVMKEFYNMLCSSFGMPPKTFSFEYVDKDKNYHKVDNLTPQSFYDEYVGVNLDDYVSIINAPTSDKPFFNTFSVKYIGNVWGDKIKYLNLPLAEFKETIIKQMKDKEVVWFGSDCGKFFNRDVGYWAPEVFDYDSLFEMDFSISKEDALNARESAMNHAMVLTGVNLEDERSTKWKIENSWGETMGYKGYFVASDNWFDRYVYQAVVNKKYLSDKAKEALDKEMKELDPWDPMGTLA